MLIVGDSIISDDIKDKKFCCDIDKCKGMCCVEGDYGAPITKKEKRIITNLLPKVLPYLSDKAKKIIEKHNFFTLDCDGELVTQVVDNKDCVFAFKSETGCTFCVFQKLYLEKKIDFIKPISCHLYPIRVSEYDEMTSLNYHRWDVCKDAIEKGEKENVYVYQNCKEALIRRFGEDWYNELKTQIEGDKQ